MNEQQQHEMIWVGTLPSGDEEWSCPICGRRTLMNWEPNFKRTVLEAGDNFAIHSASKTGLASAPSQDDSKDASAEQADSQPANDDPRLGPWLAWLEKVDFENLWNDES
jgi:hypothetical protein